MQNYDKPFLCMMSAISTHIPYSLDGISNLDDKISIDVSEIESDEISRYLLLVILLIIVLENLWKN